MHGLLILLIVIFVFCFLFLIGIFVYKCIKRSADSKLDGKSSDADSETDQQYSNIPLLESDPENENGPPGYINDETQEKSQEYAYRRTRKVDRNNSVRNKPYDTFTIEAETGRIQRNYNGNPKKHDVTSVDEIKEENPDEQVQINNKEIHPIQYNQNIFQENDAQEKHQEETIAIENKNVENLEKSVNLENKVHIINHFVEVKYLEEKGEVQNDEQIVQENQNDDKQYQNEEKLRTSLEHDEEIKEVQTMNNEIEQSQHNQNLLNENAVHENNATESTEYIQNKESHKDDNYYQHVEEHETNRNLENQPQIMQNYGDVENKAVENDKHIVKENQNGDQYQYVENFEQNITGSNQEILQHNQSLKRARQEVKEEETPELPKKGKTDKDLEYLIEGSKIAVQNEEHIVQENQNDDKQYQNDEKLGTRLEQDAGWVQEIKEVQTMNNEIEQSQHNQNLLNENDPQENSITESTEYIQNKESQKDANYYVEEHETNRNLENQPQIMENDEDVDGENKAVDNKHIVKENQNDDNQFRQENITGSNQEVLQHTQSLKRAREEEKEEESPELPKKGKTDKDEGEEIIKDLENLIKDSKIAGDYNHCRELCERLQFLEDKIQNIQFSNLEKEKLQQLKEKLNERTKAFDNFGGIISEVLEYERKLDGFDKSVEDFDGDNTDLEYFNIEESLRKGFLYLKTLNTKEVSEEYNNKKIECMKTLRKLREKLLNKTNITLNTDEEKSEHYTKKIKKVISKAEKLQEELDKLEGDEHYFRESLNKYMEEVDKIDFEPVRENKREAIRTIKKVYDSLLEKVKANSFQKQNSDDDI